MNVEHQTSNIQRQIMQAHGTLRCSAFDVRCSTLVLLMVLILVPHVMAQASTNALPSLAPVYGELPPTFWEQHQSIIIIGGFALLAVVFLFLRVWLRPETLVVLPPEVLAREALTKLLHQPEDGKLLSGVSQILRRYIVVAFELPPGEMTTAEFCVVIAGHAKIGTELAQSIAGFLRACDDRKFSTAPTAAPLNAASRALDLVGLAEKIRAAQAVASITK
jgi:hypothetical protein